MGAQGYGAKLLDEVKEESLASLLRSFHLQQPDHALIRIAPLDAIIDAFIHPPLSRQQEIYHHHHDAQQRLPGQLIVSTPRPPGPTVVELAGLGPGSGKSQLSYSIIARAILPTSCNGKESAVVLFDLGLKFDILRLATVMRGVITTSQSNSSDERGEQADLDAVVKDALKHLLIFHPTSTRDLVDTLVALPAYFKTRPFAHASAHRPLGMVVVMELSSFLPRDRLDAALASDSMMNVVGERWRSLVHELRAVSEVFGCWILVTDYVLRPAEAGKEGTNDMSADLERPKKEGRLLLRPHTPSPWTGFVNVRLVVQKSEGADPLTGGRSSESAADGVRAFKICVNWFGHEEWRVEVREAVKQLRDDKIADVDFRVDETGLIFAS